MTIGKGDELWTSPGDHCRGGITRAIVRELRRRTALSRATRIFR
jgi:hypothetical protein